MKSALVKYEVYFDPQYFNAEMHLFQPYLALLSIKAPHSPLQILAIIEPCNPFPS